MYKSYSSDKAVTQDSKVTIKEFVPASVTVNAKFSGFQTSYSYYAGIDGVQKNISAANGMKNSEIKEGTVIITPKFNGVSSKLVNFKSIELLINGTKVGEAQTTAAESYTFSVPEITEWGEKKLSVKVTYTIFGGAEIFAKSAESVRYITGLPYSSSNIDLSGTKESETISFKVVSNTNIELKLIDVTASSLSRWQKGHLYVKIGNTDFGKQIEAGNTKFDNVHSDEIKLQGELLNSNGDIFLTRNTNLPGPYVKISNVSVKYN